MRLNTARFVFFSVFSVLALPHLLARAAAVCLSSVHFAATRCLCGAPPVFCLSVSRRGAGGWAFCPNKSDEKEPEARTREDVCVREHTSATRTNNCFAPTLVLSTCVCPQSLVCSRFLAAGGGRRRRRRQPGRLSLPPPHSRYAPTHTVYPRGVALLASLSADGDGRSFGRNRRRLCL